MSGANLTLPQHGHAVGTDQRSFPLANVSSPLLTTPTQQNISNKLLLIGKKIILVLGLT